MPKSKTRGGATAHRKRVQARNAKIEGDEEEKCKNSILLKK